MMDTYSAILCSAFMHCKLLDSLCEVGIHASGMLAQKSRYLLVNLLRIASGIFSESTCTDLLAVPKLVAYSTSFGSKSYPDRAHKASDLLKSLADIFSTSAFESWDGKSLNEKKKGSERDLLSRSAREAGVIGRGKVVQRYDSASPVNLSPHSSYTSTSSSSAPAISFSSHSFLSSQKFAQEARNITDIAHEMRNLSLSSKGSGTSMQTPGFLFAKTRIVDKSEFSRLVELSRVLSTKEGKDPLKWDWEAITEILEYEFQSKPERLTEG